jgi:hypothetical protein
MRVFVCLAVMGLALTGESALADEPAPADVSPKPFQKLELKNTQTFRMSDDDAAAPNKEAVEGFQKQLEMSDPETKAAILKAQRELQDKQAKEQNSESQ